MRAPKAASSTSSSRTRYGRTTCRPAAGHSAAGDRKSTRLNSSHGYISYAVFCLKKKINSTIAFDVKLIQHKFSTILTNLNDYFFSYINTHTYYYILPITSYRTTLTENHIHIIYA